MKTLFLLSRSLFVAHATAVSIQSSETNTSLSKKIGPTSVSLSAKRASIDILHDQLPLAVPCYDLVLVIEFTLGPAHNARALRAESRIKKQESRTDMRKAHICIHNSLFIILVSARYARSVLGLRALPTPLT